VDYPWFLKVHRYDSRTQLLDHLDEQVIGPVEAEVERLRLPASLIEASEPPAARR
jgi:hypothetical protein